MSDQEAAILRSTLDNRGSFFGGRSPVGLLTFEYEGSPIHGVPRVPPTALRRPLEDGDLLKGQLDDFVSLDEQLR